MPRIDPLQLLTCLGVLLAPNGGIRSAQEVRRLAGLMAKFSNRLVSKCIYIQILKCTDTELLGQFMGTGGWTLTHMWLQDGILTKNYPLVQEILELLLLCPVDVDRLKSNSAPKLVKQLSKESHEGVRILALKLVEQWLKIVKGETVNGSPSVPQIKDATGVPDTVDGLQKTDSGEEFSSQSTVAEPKDNVDEVLSEKDFTGSVECMENGVDAEKGGSKVNHKNNSLVYKITVKDGKQVLAKVDSPTRTSPAKSVSAAEKENRESGKESKDKTKSKRDERDKSKSKDKKSDKEREKEREKHKDKKSSHRSSTSSSSSGKSSSHRSSSDKSSSSGKSSSRDKERDRDKEKDRSKSSSSSSSSKSSSRDKDKEKEKERHREKERAEKEKEKADKVEKDKASQAEKDKDTLAKIMGTGHLEKLGKIPKKAKTEGDSPKEKDKEAPAKPVPPPKKPSSISIEQRKDGENRPNTVKKFNSQFRSHGLEEAPPPPASRRNPKKPAEPLIPPKPLSVSTNSTSSSKTPASDSGSGIPEKKLKLDLSAVTNAASTTGASSGEKTPQTPTDKPQSPEKTTIKAPAPPRAKPSTLVETDVFMDALCSTAFTNRKDVKKRKRRPSSSKDGAKEGSPPESPTVSSPKAAPLKFYQDTLEVSEDAEKEVEVKNEKTEEVGSTAGDADADEDVIKNKRLKSEKADSMDVDEDSEGKKKAIKASKEEEKKEAIVEEEVKPRVPGPGCGPDGPPGVLVIHRRKGPKKSVKWKPQEELESIQYFELDETERVNVTKTFTEMKQQDRFGEREAFMMARKLSADDVMMEQIPYRPLIVVDDVPPHPMGAQSKEKKIQAEREQTVLKALYFNRMMIPDSPAEPDMEQYKITDPAVIPLDDGNPENENDFTNTPWPDPKDTPPHVSGALQADQAFNQFNMMAGGPQAMGPNPWQMGGPPFAQFNMAGFPPQGMDQGNPMGFPMTDDMNAPPMNMVPFPGGPNPNFMGGPGVPFNGFPGDMGNPQMMGMNMPRGPPPNMPPGGGWFRPNAPPNWRPPPRNNWIQNRDNRICKLYRKGFCKKGDKCNFLHPGGNNRR
uniref:Serine/threonine-protein phosphatase 1 regulatory subunit 10 n=1 Tax=Lutzomyia longipalpis TaxID=7200 RepID=A0A1B0CHK2_LUTLO